MKTVLTFLASCIVAITATAQAIADIEVSYTASVPNFRTGKADKTNQFILLANSVESKFYSPATEYIDSLQSTPEGEAKYKEMSRSAYLGGKMNQMPRRDGQYYVVKSSTSGYMTCYDVNGLEKYRVEELLPQWEWQITDSTKSILGYECILATTDFHGHEWNAWFSPDIPLANGPWKLGGLPGLILEANESNGLYNFTATGLQHSSRQITPVYSAGDYDKIDRKDLLAAKRKFIDNPVSQMNAQLSGLGISISASANEISHKSREEVDFIETDY